MRKTPTCCCLLIILIGAFCCAPLCAPATGKKCPDIQSGSPVVFCPDDNPNANPDGVLHTDEQHIIDHKQSILVIDTILFEGNKLTHDRVILRELLFSPGDTLPAKKLTKKMNDSRSNLMNTGLFNFVYLDANHTNHPSVTITCTFVERWNIWPIPVVELDEPNLNQWLENPSFARFNYGIHLTLVSPTGRNERIRLSAKAGNVQSVDLFLQTPYFDQNQRFRWGLHARMDRTKRRAYDTYDNEQLFLKLDDDYAANEYLLSGHLDIRPGLYNFFRVRLGYHYHHYADTLLLLNPRFTPDGETQFSFLSIGCSFRRDRRDIASYPLRGYMVNSSITRQGLSLLDDEIMDITTLSASFRHYLPLKGKWYAAWSVGAKWSEGTTLSYFNKDGLGYTRSLIRGYESYVIDGYKYLIMKSNLKYNLLPERVSEIGFVSSEKFSLIHYALYVNLFVDAGIISDRHQQDNTLANRWLTGTGVGIDFHTYYDKVLRTEFSINRHGKAGVFFHLVAPI